MAKAFSRVTARDTAVFTLRAWLKAAGIPHRSSSVSGCDLVVTAKDGKEIQVVVAAGKPGNHPDGAIVLKAEEIRCSRLSKTHANHPGKTPLQIAFQSFHSLTNAAGYGSPIPFNRGEEPDRMFSFEEDDFLVSFRHTEFRRAPNPPAGKFEQYRNILERQAYLFYVTNQNLCERHVTSQEDLLTFARFCLVSFCAHHERPNPIKYGNDGDENATLLTEYLKQRFAGLRRNWLSRFFATLPVGGELSLVSFETPRKFNGTHPHYDDLNSGPSFEGIRHETSVAENVFSLNSWEEEALSTEEALPLVSEAEEEEQRRRAKERLEAALASMPHQQMIETLRNISKDEQFDEETRKAASRQILLHSRRCAECSAEGAEVEEEAPAADSGSAEEEFANASE